MTRSDKHPEKELKEDIQEIFKDPMDIEYPDA